MSESFYILLSRLDEHLPPIDVARAFIDKHSIMDAHAIYHSVSHLPVVAKNLSMVRDFVSDMDRTELANVLIRYIDIHYHELLVEIDQDDKKRSLFRGAMSVALDDLMGREAS